jgi:undecaprenyl-diphosphatase
MVAAASWAEPAFAAVVVIWFLLGWLRNRRQDRLGAIMAIMAAAGALLANQVISHLWARPRPFAVHPSTVHLLLGHSKDASFPSDHAAAAFAIGLVLISFHHRLGAVALAFAALMSYARVYVGDHYPGDVAAGALVGLLASALVLTWLRPLAASLERLADRALAVVWLPHPSR